jgi:hypothetical protein
MDIGDSLKTLATRQYLSANSCHRIGARRPNPCASAPAVHHNAIEISVLSE